MYRWKVKTTIKRRLHDGRYKSEEENSPEFEKKSDAIEYAKKRNYLKETIESSLWRLEPSGEREYWLPKEEVIGGIPSDRPLHEYCSEKCKREMKEEVINIINNDIYYNIIMSGEYDDASTVCELLEYYMPISPGKKLYKFYKYFETYGTRMKISYLFNGLVIDNGIYNNDVLHYLFGLHEEKNGIITFNNELLMKQNGKSIKEIMRIRIPTGPYCYDENGQCPYWSIDNSQEYQNNGFCRYLNRGDWDRYPFSLLWDQVKECGIKNDLLNECGEYN